MSGDSPIHARAHAKLNLSLRVLAREASGYHQIETLFCALELADDIEVSRAGKGIALDVALPPDQSGPVPDLGPVEQNLAYRAAALFARVAQVADDIHIRLTKRIPAGAGLGGGSSDAAAVLTALNRLHARALPVHDLFALGAQLGSDVPFFLADAPLALAWGRGERIAPLPPLPAAPVVLAIPHERVSTAGAYAALAGARTVAAVVEIPRTWSDIARTAHNDFEEITFAQHPRLGALRHELEDDGALIARMTGTGSVVYGVFDNYAAAEAAARRISGAHPDIRAVVTQTRSVPD